MAPVLRWLLTTVVVVSVLFGECARADFNSPIVSSATFGTDPSGVGDNSAALTRIFALTGGQTIYFPEGTYKVACGHAFAASSAVSLVGAGKGKTIIQLASGCSVTTDVMSWTNFGGVKFQGITLDLNTPTTGTQQYAGLGFTVSGSNSLVGPQILDSEVLNLGSSSARADNIRLTVASNSAAWLNPIIANTRLTKAVADGATANNCIDFGGTGAGDSTSLGTIHYAKVVNNVCVNTGMQIDGDHGYYAGNDISGWAFGNGIFTIYNQSGPSVPTSDHDNVFSGNTIHDSPAGYDVNSSAASCVENNGYANVWVGNDMHGCGGEGFRNYGEYTKIVGNTIYNNAKTTSIVGNYKRAGIHLALSGIGEPYQSKNVYIDGNTVYDTTSTQLYAFADETGIDGPVYFTENELSGSTDVLLQASSQGTLRGVWQKTSLTQASGLGCGSSGPLGSATATVRYRQRPLATDVDGSIAITTNSTCATSLTVTLPVAMDPGTNSNDVIMIGGNATTGASITGFLLHGATTTLVLKKSADASYPGADSTAISFTGSYPTDP